MVDDSITEERQRVSGIIDLCRGLGMEPDGFIKEGKTLEETRAAVLEHLKQHGAPSTICATSI